MLREQTVHTVSVQDGLCMRGVCAFGPLLRRPAAFSSETPVSILHERGWVDLYLAECVSVLYAPHATLLATMGRGSGFRIGEMCGCWPRPLSRFGILGSGHRRLFARLQSAQSLASKHACGTAILTHVSSPANCHGRCTVGR